MRSRELITGLTLAAVITGLGATACTSGAGETVSSNTAAGTPISPNCAPFEPLKSLNLVGAAKSGVENAKNTGPCAADVYSPDTGRDIGSIASGSAFLIECRDYRPEAFKVETADHLVGFTNLDGTALQQAQQGQFVDIPLCQDLTPVISV